MKKTLSAFLGIILTVFLVSLLFSTVKVKAEEAIIDDVEETIEIIEEPQTIENTENKGLTVEDVKKEIKEFAEKNINSEQIRQIISWIFDGSVGVFAIATYIKYRKYKHNTLEDVVKTVRAELNDYLVKQFDGLKTETIKPIVDNLGTLQGGLDTVMKVLVLMQDSTANGKVALIEYLGSKTESKEVKESVEAVKEIVEEEKKIKDNVNKEVSGEYKEIPLF